MSIWLNEGKIAKNSEGKIYTCDDCPCDACGAFASSYVVSNARSGTVTSIALADLRLQQGTAMQAYYDARPNHCYWHGLDTLNPAVHIIINFDPTFAATPDGSIFWNSNSPFSVPNQENFLNTVIPGVYASWTIV